MGSIEPYTTSAGRRWRVRYRKPTGQQTDKRGFATKAAAIAYLHEVESSKSSGTYLDPARGKVTVTDLAKVWIDGKVNVKESTRDRYQGIIATWITPTLGSVKVADLQHSDIQAWVNAQTCSAASVVKNHRVLAQILELAVRDRRILSNPAKVVNLPRVRHAKRRYLTVEQVESLAASASRWANRSHRFRRPKSS